MEHGKALKHQYKPTDLSSSLDLTLHLMDKVAQGVERTITGGFTGGREMQHGRLKGCVSRRREINERFMKRKVRSRGSSGTNWETVGVTNWESVDRTNCDSRNASFWELGVNHSRNSVHAWTPSVSPITSSFCEALLER
jgi:hypothetical protein